MSELLLTDTVDVVGKKLDKKKYRIYGILSKSFEFREEEISLKFQVAADGEFAGENPEKGSRADEASNGDRKV